MDKKEEKEITKQKCEYLHKVYQISLTKKEKQKRDIFSDWMVALDCLLTYSLHCIQTEQLDEHSLSFPLVPLIQLYIQEINLAGDALKGVSLEEQLGVISKAVELLASHYCENKRHEQSFIKEQTITINNLQQIYRQMGKVQLAQNCLKSVVELQKKQPEQIVPLIGNLLNQSVLLSEVNQHSQALCCIQQAIECLPIARNRHKDNQQIQQEITQLQMISSYNLAAEYEFMQQYQLARQHYQESRLVAVQLADHQLQAKIDKAIKSIQAK